MYFEDYENYYNEPSEVDDLFNEYSEKLKTMLKNEVVENAKKYDINKDEVKTMMSVANGLKEEYERKLEEFDNQINNKAMEYHNKWLEKLLGSDLKIGDTVYKIISNGSTKLQCPYCNKGKIEVNLKDKTEEVQCPICNGWSPSLQKYTFKKTKIINMKITLNTSEKNKRVEPYVDTWIDIPDYPFDKVNCNWNIKDENWDTLKSDRVARTEEEAKQIIEKLNNEEISKLELKYGKDNVKDMLKNIEK